MPRELIAPARERVAFRDYEREPLAPDQVRVRSEFGTAKHGTEMAVYKGYGLPRGRYDGELGIFTGTAGDGEAGGRDPFPIRLGNMCIGEVIEAGGAVTEVQPRDRVFAHGGFRQEHVWPANRVRVLPEGVPWQAAACLDPTDFALGAVRDGHVRIGDAVAVFGMGAIGLMALQLARLGRGAPGDRRGPDRVAPRGGARAGRRPYPRPVHLRRRQGDPPGHRAPRRRRVHRIQRPSHRPAGRAARRPLPGHGGGRRLPRRLPGGSRPGRRGALQPPHHRVLARLLGAQSGVPGLERAAAVRGELAATDRRQPALRAGGAAGGRLRRPAHRVPQDRHRARDTTSSSACGSEPGERGESCPTTRRPSPRHSIRCSPRSCNGR